MKLIVLCGGKGTRLGDLTKDIPKALVKIGKKRIVDIALEPHHEMDLVFSAGYKGLVMSTFVCTNYTKSECYLENEPLGTGGSVKEIACGFDDDYFAVLNGDTYIDIDFKLILSKFMHMDYLACPILSPSAINDISSYSGAYVFKKEFLNYIKDTPFHLEDAIRACKEDGKAIFFRTGKHFYDLGTHEGIEKYKEVFL